MMETTVILKPKNEWRKKPLLNLCHWKIPIFDELVEEMDRAMQFPALVMPGPCRLRRALICSPQACVHL